jgi:hypothetical protein
MKQHACVAIQDRSGTYVGYNPHEWPGNAVVLVCKRHVRYADLTEPKRLTRRALLYLTFHGGNWYKVIFIVHGLATLVGFVLFVSGLARSRSTAE